MTALLEDDPKKARNQYLKSCELDDVDDQEVHDLFQSRVFDAIMRHEPSVEIERELAQRLLLVVKNGIKRRRGGQRNTRQQRLRKRAVVDMACAIKAKLESKGMRATDARLEAAEAASGEARKRGIEYSPSYIQREMERLAKRQFGTRFR
jgi:hypothetical protein